MSLSDYQQMEGETDDNFIQNMAIVGPIYKLLRPAKKIHF